MFQIFLIQYCCSLCEKKKHITWDNFVHKDSVVLTATTANYLK